MDWREITHKYPKAWEEMCQHFNDGIGRVGLHNSWGLYWYGDTKELSHPIHIRELYDFFDAQGIIVLIEFSNDKWTWWVKWFDKNNYGGIGLPLKQGLDNREDIEESAFIQAFKVFEEQPNER